MKKFAKRSMMLLVVLAILISLLPALTLPADAATVNYVKDGKYVYNWGTREETATFLSPMAEDFYEANNITYADLAALSGSATTSSVPSSALYKKLQNLMKSNHDNETSYNGTRELFQYTDCQQSGNWNSGKISSFYSGKAIGPAWDGGKTWNREHTWPNSKGDASGNGENDIIMLRPTASSENSSRGNKAYGESSSYYHPNSESNGDHDLRGDVARIMLFVYVRWGNTGSMWGTNGVIENETILLKWIEADPVDTWELGRNDSVESITGTRNVFVDYPELAFLLFGEEVPEGMDTPSGNAKTCPHKDSVTVAAVAASCTQGGNTAGRYCHDCRKYYDGYATTSALGHSYTGVVTPPTATAQGYTTYTCSRCDDSYVNNYTDALGQTYTVSFVVPAGVTAVADMACNKTGIALPAADVPTGEYTYTFAGWTVAPVEDTQTAPVIYNAGSTYVATANTTLYAVYTYGVGGTGVSEYVLTDLNKIQSTDTVVITVDYQGTVYALDSGNGASAAPDAVIVTVSDNKLTAAPADTLKWNIVSDANGYIIYPAGQTSKWLYSTNNNNGIRVGTNANKYFTYVSGYFKNLGTNRYMGVYRGKPDWRCYTSTTTNITDETYGFYVKTSAGTLYYTTLSATACSHANTTTTTVNATCTADGSSVVICDDCGATVSAKTIDALGHATITHAAKAPTCTDYGWNAYVTCSRCNYTTYATKPATGHDHKTAVTAPTCTAEGYTTYTCSECGDTYTSDKVAAKGHNWNAATCTTAKTCTTCGATEGTALGHKEQVIAGKAATCTGTGLTEGKRCTACGESLIAQTVIPALGHTDSNRDFSCDVCNSALCVNHVKQTVPGKKATCTETGLTEGTKCSVCGDTLVAQTVVAALGHNWKNATCTTPKTCTTCGATEGNAAGHSWKAATCTAPKTCTTCGATSGSANGHSWKAATCTTPKTCTTCGATEGNAAGHSWKAATCTAPKTCTTCGATSGSANGHSWKAATCTAPKTCTTCGTTEGNAAGHSWKNATCTTPKTCTRCKATVGKPVAHIYANGLDGTCNVCGIHRETTEKRNVMHMFRMYDPNSGEHFYTGSTVERENLVAAGWHYEGVGFTFSQTTGSPVYRLYDPVYGEHLYTMDEAEKAALMAAGWNLEGIAFNSAYDTEVPQYRLHNPNAKRGAYHFTASVEERDFLISLGWEYQGIGFYSSWK